MEERRERNKREGGMKRERDGVRKTKRLTQCDMHWRWRQNGGIESLCLCASPELAFV